MEISMDVIKALRDETGVSVMQCKKALEEAGGDIEKAKVVLRKLSSAAAAKKGERSLGAGVVQAYVHAGNTVGAIVVLGCETDFVARNDEFVRLAYDIAMHIAAAAPKFASREGVQESDIAAARAVFEREIANVPEARREMALQGKIDAYLKELVLIEQPFIKDSTTTVGELLERATQKFGERIVVVSFGRYGTK